MTNDRSNLQGNMEIALPGCGPLRIPFSETVRPLRQQIFELVRSAGAIPRVELAKQLRISPASVTTITSALIEGGLLEEVSSPQDLESGRGRPAVALGVRGSAHHVVGLNISDREFTAVIMDFSGNLMASETIARPPGPTELSLILESTETLIDCVCSHADIERHTLSAIGVGLPGFVDAPSGIVHWSPIFRNRDVMFARAMSDLLSIPVYVDNDANMVTLAEQWFGVGRTLSDFAVVTIEQGLGMGLVVNGSLYRGALGIGMELGHTKVQLDGALCRCGQRGCLEAYVADYALVREAQTALNLTVREMQSVGMLLERLHIQAEAGDAVAHSIFRRAGRYLALGLANIVNLFDPSLIILSGERMRYDYLFPQETLMEMETMALDFGHPPPRVEVHAWGHLGCAKGEAALALSKVTEGLFAIAKGGTAT